MGRALPTVHAHPPGNPVVGPDARAISPRRQGSDAIGSIPLPLLGLCEEPRPHPAAVIPTPIARDEYCVPGTPVGLQEQGAVTGSELTTLGDSRMRGCKT